VLYKIARAPIVGTRFQVEAEILNAQIRQPTATIDRKKGELSVAFNYGSGWSGYGNVLNPPRRLLFRLLDRFGKEIGRFDSKEQFFPAKFFERMKSDEKMRRVHSGAFQMIEIARSEGTLNLLQEAGNVLNFPLNAIQSDYIRGIELGFETGGLGDGTLYLKEE